jgi:TonB family protein
MSFVLLMALVGAEMPAMSNAECPLGDDKIIAAPCPARSKYAAREKGPTATEVAGRPDKSAPAEPANNRGTWVRSEDYPTAALRDEIVGITGIEITVGEDGKPIHCEVTQSSGNLDLDTAACRSASSRALFFPARDVAGNPVVGSYSTIVRWQIPDYGPMDIPKPTKSVLSFIIEKDGTISNCRFVTSNRHLSNPCGYRESFNPPINANGEPVRKKVTRAFVETVSDIDDSEIDDSEKASPH